MSELSPPINGTEQRLDVVISLLREIRDAVKPEYIELVAGRIEEIPLREPVAEKKSKK